MCNILFWQTSFSSIMTWVYHACSLTWVCEACSLIIYFRASSASCHMKHKHPNRIRRLHWTQISQLHDQMILYTGWDTLCRCPLSGLFWFAKQRRSNSVALWAKTIALQIKTILTMGSTIGYPTVCICRYVYPLFIFCIEQARLDGWFYL